MPTALRRPATMLLAALFVVAACADDVDDADDPSAEAAAAVTHTVSVLPACSEEGGIAGDIPDWPMSGSADAEFLPVVMSSLVTGGYNRFLYNVLDESYRQVAAPDVASRVDFYALERDPGTPVARAGATYLSSGLGRGLYRTEVEFDCIGEWGAEVFVEDVDGDWLSERLRFAVDPLGDTPAIGAEPPRSNSLIASTSDEVAHISTDTNPYLPAYDKTVAQTVDSGKPSFIFFATPAFCQTGFCGPTVELVKNVAKEHVGELEFVNVEPYELQMTENGLQPLLTEDGQLQPVEAALEWGIPVEPYLFLLDEDGRVFAKFEGIVGGEELRAAVEDVLAA